jgi:hypothetical protein
MVRATYPEVVTAFAVSGGQPWLTPPYLVLHREEFAWPRLSPRAPVRSYIKPLWGRTISPITSVIRSELSKEIPINRWAGLFSVALVVIQACARMPRR